MVSKHPAEIDRLDALLGASKIAHEAIFEMRRELIADGQGDTAQDLLLEESARIVTKALPRLTETARDLAGSWIEQNLFDPSAAEITLDELMTELERIEPEVKALLHR